MSYLDQLRAAEFAERAGSPTLKTLNTPGSGGFEGFEGYPPGPFQKIEALLTAADTEHAAIRDSQVGEFRATATNAARSAMRVYRASIAMGLGAPVLWVTLIAPGADLATATGIARGQFGAARLLSLVEHSVHRRVC
jgi:hypothetical protein